GLACRSLRACKVHRQMRRRQPTHVILAVPRSRGDAIRMKKMGRRTERMIASLRLQMKERISRRRVRELKARNRRSVRICELILASDVSKPKHFGPRERSALRATAALACDNELELRRYRRATSARARELAADSVCINVQAASQAHQLVMLTCYFIQGVRARVRRSSSVDRLLREHRELLDEISDATTGEERRLSALLDLIHVEQLLLGYLCRFLPPPSPAPRPPSSTNPGRERNSPLIASLLAQPSHVLGEQPRFEVSERVFPLEHLPIGRTLGAESLKRGAPRMASTVYTSRYDLRRIGLAGLLADECWRECSPHRHGRRHWSPPGPVDSSPLLVRPRRRAAHRTRPGKGTGARLHHRMARRQSGRRRGGCCRKRLCHGGWEPRPRVHERGRSHSSVGNCRQR